MFYQETYQAGGNPAKLNISSVIYEKKIAPYSETTDAVTGSVPGFPMHCHSFYEICYTIEGTSLAETDNRTVTLSPGSFTFYTPLTVHKNRRDRRPSLLILQFSPRLLENIFSSKSGNLTFVPAGELQKNGFLDITESSPLHGPMQELMRLSPRICLPEEEHSYKIYSYPEHTEIALAAAVTSLLSVLMETGCLTLAASALNASNLSKMQNLLDRLTTAPEEKLSMEDAAAMVNMSYSNFCRTFKSTFGVPYVDFCNTLRIKRAQELLYFTNMSVTEISTQLNFGSISYFNRIFKKHTGFTPLNYRAAR